MQLSQRAGLLILTIEDDGKGFNPDHFAGGTGMHSVRRRVKAMNGHLEVCSERGRGSSVYLEFET